jgi:hypothetical protein
MYIDFKTYVLVYTCMCGAENHENVLLEYLPDFTTYYQYVPSMTVA